METETGGPRIAPGQDRLDFPRLLNARDLGGLRMRGGARTRARAFLRTDDLCNLTPDGVRKLVDYGLTSVIDLRWPEELAGRSNPFQDGHDSVRWTHVSLLADSEPAWRAKSADVPKERWNIEVLDHSGPEIAEVFRAVAEAPRGVVLFHCKAGKDRTGVVAALLLAVADVEPEDIAWDYAVSTEYIRDAYLASHAPERRAAVLEDVRCPPEQVATMLAHLEERWGGVKRYLASLGLGSRELNAVRTRLGATRIMAL
jgi:protein-tyrosine phosphatase